VSPSDFIKGIYLDLINDAGWTLESIDEMDFFYYLDLMLYNSTNEKSEWDRPSAYIDQI